MNPGDIVIGRGRGRGSLRLGQNITQLRRPQNSQQSTSSNSVNPGVPASLPLGEPRSHLNKDGAGEDTVPCSNLSADAKEFYPRDFSQSSRQEGDIEDVQYTQYRPTKHEQELLQLQAQQGRNTYESRKHLVCSKPNTNQRIINNLMDTIQLITRCPGRFDQLVTYLLEELSGWLSSEETVVSIVSIIIQQSVSEGNFRYSGARLCNAINNHFEPGEKSVFRSCLLNKLCEEFHKLSEYLEQDPVTAHGYLLFVAELYIQLEVRCGSGIRISILGHAIIDAVHLLMKVPTNESIKCVCQVLKLTGHVLDQDKAVEMDAIFMRLKCFLDTVWIDPRISAMICSVSELRRSNWGQGPAADEQQACSLACASGYYENSNLPEGNEAVLYGPDGLQLTQEETHFLNESVVVRGLLYEMQSLGEWDEDEMDEEIQEAYEEFVDSISKC